MQGTTCNSCRKERHSSNLIGGMVCFYCEEKELHNSRMMIKFFEFFSPIYKITPIIAVAISLIYIIINPTDLTWYLIITAVVFAICLFGMLPNIFPNSSSTELQERELKLKTYLKNYTPKTVSYCLYHSEQEAVGRCSICFDPFCAEEFIYIDQNPAFCRKCRPHYRMAAVNMLASLNAIFSLALLAGVGIYYNVVYSGYYGFNVGLIAFLIIIIIVVVMIYRAQKQYKSQLESLINSHLIQTEK